MKKGKFTFKVIANEVKQSCVGITRLLRHKCLAMTGMVCALCLLPLSTMAETTVTPTCNGGTLVTANAASDSTKGVDCGTGNEKCNGDTFCKSDKPMNWWSAWAWCESNHRVLAEISKMCPKRSGTECPNLNKPTGATSGYVWSKTPSGTDSFNVNLSSGSVNGSGHGARYNYYYAFCE